jgi:hypothetical protein
MAMPAVKRPIVAHMMIFKILFTFSPLFGESYLLIMETVCSLCIPLEDNVFQNASWNHNHHSQIVARDPSDTVRLFFRF